MKLFNSIVLISGLSLSSVISAASIDASAEQPLLQEYQQAQEQGAASVEARSKQEVIDARVRAAVKARVARQDAEDAKARKLQEKALAKAKKERVALERKARMAAQAEARREARRNALQTVTQSAELSDSAVDEPATRDVNADNHSVDPSIVGNTPIVVESAPIVVEPEPVVVESAPVPEQRDATVVVQSPPDNYSTGSISEIADAAKQMRALFAMRKEGLITPDEFVRRKERIIWGRPGH